MAFSWYLADATVIIGVTILLLHARFSAASRLLQATDPLPLLCYPFAPFKFPGALFGSNKWNPGTLFPWRNRGRLYEGVYAQTVAVIGYLDNFIVIFSSSFEVISQVTAPRSAWDRPKIMADIQNIPRNAMNVATAQMDKYHRHRRVVGPAFNQGLYQQVWEESLRSFGALGLEAGWNEVTEVRVPALQDLTAKFTLSIIGRVGFGLSDNSTDSNLRRAFEITAQNALLRTTLPSWMFRLPIPGLQRIKSASDHLISTMHKQIDARRADIAVDNNPTENQRDIFNYLISANASESASTGLDEEELLSNIFILLFAGHESAAKTLASTLALLACHPDEQERVYKEIRSAVPEDEEPTIEDFDSLKSVSECLMEALRLFSVGPVIMREATEATALRVPGKEHPVILPKGTMFIGDIVGINYDAERYPEPRAFRPLRWASKHELVAEDYISFGNGVHACLGRKFAMYEMVCFLVQLLRMWRVEPDLAGGESLSEWRERVLDGSIRMAIIMTPGDIPVKLCRRG